MQKKKKPNKQKAISAEKMLLPLLASSDNKCHSILHFNKVLERQDELLSAIIRTLNLLFPLNISISNLTQPEHVYISEKSEHLRSGIFAWLSKFQ